MATTAVGTLKTSTTAGATTLAVSPTAVGNALLLAVKIKSPTITITAVSGGGCTWVRAGGWTDPTTDTGLREELWLGTVTAAGSSTITITPSASTAGLSTDLACQEFSSGLGAGTIWSADTSGHTSATSATAVTLASLTPAAAGETYLGYVWIGMTGSAGSTSGYTYDQLPNGNWIVFDPSCTSAAQAPTMTQSPAGAWSSVAALVKASTGSTAAAGTMAHTWAASGAVTVTPPQVAPVLYVMLENQQKSNVIGSADAPNINSLAGQFVQLTNAWGTAHPSLPNYLEVFSGSTHNVTDDQPPADHDLSGVDNLGSQLTAAGYHWAGYFQSLSGDPTTNEGATDPSGEPLYQPHHNPLVYFGITDAAHNLTYTDAASFAAALDATPSPEFVWLSPDMMHDMHDPVGTSSDDASAVSTGDTFLDDLVAAVQGTDWYKVRGGTIIIVADEAYDTTGTQVAGGIGSPATTGGPVPGIVVSQALAGHANYSTGLSHAGILRGVETHFGLPLLVDAGGASYGDITTLLAPPIVASGTMPHTWAASGSAGVEVAASGSQPHTWTATGAATVDVAAAGTAALSWAATGAATVELHAAGTMAHTWAAVGPAGIEVAASGQMAATWAASGTAIVEVAAAGVLPLGWTAQGSAGDTSGASGALPLTWTATGAAGIQVAASGTITNQWAASGAAGVQVAASGTQPHTWAATGSAGVETSTSGGLPLGWAGEGIVAVEGQTNGFIKYTWSATGPAGVEIPVSGATSLPWAASGAAVVEVAAAGATALAWAASGAASVKVPVSGGIAHTWQATGAATTITTPTGRLPLTWAASGQAGVEVAASGTMALDLVMVGRIGGTPVAVVAAQARTLAAAAQARALTVEAQHP